MRRSVPSSYDEHGVPVQKLDGRALVAGRLVKARPVRHRVRESPGRNDLPVEHLDGPVGPPAGGELSSHCSNH